MKLKLQFHYRSLYQTVVLSLLILHSIDIQSMLGILQVYSNVTNQVSSSNSHRQDRVHPVSFQGIKECILTIFVKFEFSLTQLLLSMIDSFVMKVMALISSL